MNTLNFKEGQTYVCTKSDGKYRKWWTVDKEYKVVLDDLNEAVLLDDDNSYWSSTELATHNLNFKLKEEQPKVTTEDVTSNKVEPMYTPRDVNKIIIKAYQMYDNDAQRLAFIKGYFAK